MLPYYHSVTSYCHIYCQNHVHSTIKTNWSPTKPLNGFPRRCQAWKTWHGQLHHCGRQRIHRGGVKNPTGRDVEPMAGGRYARTRYSNSWTGGRGENPWRFKGIDRKKTGWWGPYTSLLWCYCTWHLVTHWAWSRYWCSGHWKSEIGEKVDL